MLAYPQNTKDRTICTDIENCPNKLGKKKSKLQSVVFKKAYATPKYTIAYAWKAPETNMRNCERLILLFRGNPFCPHVQLEFLTIIMGYFYNFKSSEN